MSERTSSRPGNASPENTQHAPVAPAVGGPWTPERCAEEQAHLDAIETLLDTKLVSYVLRTFQCATDETPIVLAFEEPPTAHGLRITLGLTSLATIRAALDREGLLCAEDVAEICTTLSENVPCGRWMVIRACSGVMATKLLLRSGGEA